MRISVLSIDKGESGQDVVKFQIGNRIVDCEMKMKSFGELEGWTYGSSVIQAVADHTGFSKGFGENYECYFFWRFTAISMGLRGLARRAD